MAKQFGRFTIRADGLDDIEAYRYEAQVLGMLHGLDAMQTGHAVLNAIRFYQREVLVYPYDGRLGKCNAAEYEDWGLFRTKVAFTPLLFFHSPCSALKGSAGMSPHATLIHELTHAARSVAKKFGSIKDHPGGAQVAEEDLAMLVANIFLSENHQCLRTSYDNPDPEGQCATAAPYSSSLIEKFCDQQKEFSRMLARVKAPFNPLRVYFDRVRPPGW